MTTASLICYGLAALTSVISLYLVHLALNGFKCSKVQKNRPLGDKLYILSFGALAVLIAIAAFFAAPSFGNH